MAGDLIPVPSLLSRSVTMWLSGGAAALAVLGVVVWALLTQPLGNRIAAGILGAVVAGLLVAVVARRTRLDPYRGCLVRDVAGLRRRSLAWADARVLQVRDNRGGQLLLEVRGPAGRPMYVGLVAVDLGGDRSQPPVVLRALADQIETWAPHRDAVVRALRAQADHLTAGGGVRDSPLVLAHSSATP